MVLKKRRMPPRAGKIPLGIAALLGAALVGLVFLLPGNRVIGAADTDLIRQFLAWRDFAAQSVLAGHLPLWNPYTYSGQPFLAGFQSGLLYPPNVIFLVLPLCRAANLSLLLHLVILGWGMHRLASRRGLGPLAAGVCAGLLPLSGAVFPHLYAGHLSNLCTLAWTPWIFAGLEDFYRERRLQGLLLASATAALQILAGHVQYVFYTAVAAGLQALVFSFAEPSFRRRALPAVAVTYAAAAALAAAQLLPGLAGVGQGIRHTGLGFHFASMFSFPVENLLTFVAPGFFGDLAAHPYWGRGYLWEMSVFVGLSGIVLAGAALADPERKRAARLDLAMTGLLLLLALGDHTPIFGLLYAHVPGFDRFRGVAKFTFPATMFLILAVGAGVDALVRGRVPRRTPALCLLGAGAAAALAGLALAGSPGALAGWLAQIQESGESYLAAPSFTDPAFIRDAGAHAGWSLVQAGAILALIGAGWLLAGRHPALRWTPLALLPLEMIAFAGTHFATADVGNVLPEQLQAYVAAHPGDYRVLNPAVPNNGFFLGAPDLWGNDPGPLSRYAEFIAYTQGGDPDRVSQNLHFHSFPPVYTMLRFRCAFLISDNRIDVVDAAEPPMPRVQLVSGYQLPGGRDAIFAALTSPDFDPRRTVLLESEPDPAPVAGDNPGAVRVLAATPDTLTVEAEVSRPTLLLITDLYDRDWRARSLGDAPQSSYTVLPANYVLRAIPLAAGHHRILVEYTPRGFHAGLAVSLGAWLLWLGLAYRLRQGVRS